MPLDARTCWNILSTNCRVESKNNCQQSDHRERKHAVIARAKRMLFGSFDTHRADVSGFRFQVDKTSK
jgi:hypothetical protein